MTAPTVDCPAERVLALRCAHCGHVFERLRPHQKFCRPSCRRAAFTRRGQRRLPFDDLDHLFDVPFE